MARGTVLYVRLVSELQMISDLPYTAQSVGGPRMSVAQALNSRFAHSSGIRLNSAAASAVAGIRIRRVKHMFTVQPTFKFQHAAIRARATAHKTVDFAFMDIADEPVDPMAN
jgi:hypothetical protein